MFLSSFHFEYLTKKNDTDRIRMTEHNMIMSNTGNPPIPLMKYMNGLKHSGFTLTGLSPF